MAYSSPLQPLHLRMLRREMPMASRIEMPVTPAPQLTIVSEIRYLGVRLLVPFIIVALFVLCLLPSIRRELAEHGWPRGIFKWLVVSVGYAIIGLLARVW